MHFLRLREHICRLAFLETCVSVPPKHSLLSLQINYSFIAGCQLLPLPRNPRMQESICVCFKWPMLSELVGKSTTHDAKIHQSNNCKTYRFGCKYTWVLTLKSRFAWYWITYLSLPNYQEVAQLCAYVVLPSSNERMKNPGTKTILNIGNIFQPAKWQFCDGLEP